MLCLQLKWRRIHKAWWKGGGKDLMRNWAGTCFMSLNLKQLSWVQSRLKLQALYETIKILSKSKFECNKNERCQNDGDTSKMREYSCRLLSGLCHLNLKRDFFNLKQSQLKSVTFQHLKICWYLLFSFTFPNMENAFTSIKAFPPAIIYPRLLRQAATVKVIPGLNSEKRRNKEEKRVLLCRMTETKQNYGRLEWYFCVFGWSYVIFFLKKVSESCFHPAPLVSISLYFNICSTPHETQREKLISALSYLSENA